ncbi:coiled-coil domain-containing protein 181 isoform X2 [Pseudoliparis swirei]|uniref:coiled-coil domain-containing protein 181 isoform X2 n=1 Tax=Pseudoliparis swirei TaxID=2059687 RepID=UPI0024BE5DAF|nr:coiled-coil domain-containing protein 181 isoform X2 [Pseudoliparis swirei]
MSEVVCTKPQEEYEDDFEKDLDWLICEESRSEDQGPDFDDIEAEIDKELEDDDEQKGKKRKLNRHKEEKRGTKTGELEEDEERWPSPMEPFEFDSDRDSPNKSSSIAPPPPRMEEQTEEEKKFILEKIQQANQDLHDQEAPDMTRRRRLHFKETLVDLVVPPRQDGHTGEGEGEQGNKDSEAETDVSGKLSELKLSPRGESVGSNRAVETAEGGGKEGRVLVEKDGKFDLVSLKEVESQGLLPPLVSNSSPRHQQPTVSSSKTHRSSPFQPGTDHLRAPKPPAQPRNRPSSASHSQRGGHLVSKRRVQSATGTPSQATYTLSPHQKELLQRIRERKEKVAREEEQRKLEEEEQKRQENELAFKAWLLRKREQFHGEKRIQRAQEMEKMSSKTDSSDCEDSFRLWLQRKQEQQQKERQLVELKRLEEEAGYLLHSREECERAFKLWLKRKWAEKRAAQQVTRERSRRLVLEERRVRRTRDLLCSFNETKPFRFTEQLAYRF